MEEDRVSGYNHLGRQNGRRVQRIPVGTEPRPEQIVRFGTFEVDLEGGELRRNGIKVRLQEQPFRMLTLLLEHPGRVVTREELRTTLWPADTFVDFDQSLGTAISKVRQALGDSADNPRYVETVPRRGYRFLGQVERVSGTAARPDKKPAAELTPRGLFYRYASAAALLALIVAGVFLGWRQQSGVELPPIERTKTSIAVLPFVNIGADPEEEYFSDGLTEELINGFANVEGLRVTSRTSVYALGGEPLDIRAIGQKLNVEIILEGSVRKEGERLRITPQLINVADDSHLWSTTYDRDMRDIFDIQEEISRAVVNALKVELAGTGERWLVSRPTENLEAYNLYLKGRYFSNQRTKEGIEKAINYFGRAIAADPHLALAHAGLADVYTFQAVFAGRPIREIRPRVEQAARKAVEIDPTLAEAHLVLGKVRILDQDVSAARRDFRRAIEFNPGYAGGHHLYAMSLCVAGRLEEATTEIEIAVELDPLGITVNNDAGLIFYNARQPDRAIEYFRHAREINPDFPLTSRYLGRNYLFMQRYEEALAELKSDPLLTAATYAFMGEEAKARELFEHQKENDHRLFFSQAVLHVALREHAEAIQCLEKSYRGREMPFEYMMAGVDPLLDPLRSNPNFQALLEQMNLSD